MSPFPLSVNGAAGDVDPFLAEHHETLSKLGLVLVAGSALQGPDGVANVRVLTTWAFDDPRRYDDEFAFDPRPTLPLAPSADGVEGLLLRARDSDEVDHAEEPVSVLVRRLQRLVGRAASDRRLGDDLHRDALTGLWSRRWMTEEIDRLNGTRRRHRA